MARVASAKSRKRSDPIQVEAAGLNRTDLLQSKGFILAGQIPILGLECSGIIDQISEGVDEAWLGRKVCALLPGGDRGICCLLALGCCVCSQGS